MSETNNERYMQLAERALEGAQGYVVRLQARANHRKAAGRKLSANDTDQLRQIKAAVNESVTALDTLLDNGKGRELMARHRLRELALLDLNEPTGGI